MAPTHDSEEDVRNENILININGELVKRESANISVFDSGFLLGDGVWEGLRLYNGRWAFWEEHFDRLFEAAKAIDLDIRMDKENLFEMLEITRTQNNMYTEVHARLMVTRGKKSKPFQHPKLSIFGPTIVIIMEHSSPVKTLNMGIKLATVPQVRGLPMSQDPKLNSHSKLNCVLACIQAEKAGADEALMLDPLGFVNTTNACNFFIVKKNEVWTSTGDYCMNGITRKKVIEICLENNIPVYQRNFALSEVYSADEAFITGTFGAQTFISEIDKRKIGEGKMGPITSKIKQYYLEKIQNEC
ncbi:MAG: aminotransferase class IV [Rhodobacteraceae bacterium]|nr:MAG: aminotransferase class IV [Paracoccaceae bacterium]